MNDGKKEYSKSIITDTSANSDSRLSGIKHRTSQSKTDKLTEIVKMRPKQKVPGVNEFTAVGWQHLLIEAGKES